MAKAIPILGLAVGIIMSAREFANGNVVNGLVDLTQGIVSLIPGVGTAASLSIAAGGIVVKQINNHIQNKRD